MNEQTNDDRRRLRPLALTIAEVVKHAGIHGFTAEETGDCMLNALLLVLYQRTRSVDDIADILFAFSQRLREDEMLREQVRTSAFITEPGLH